MAWWLLLLVVTSTWILWAFAGLTQLYREKLDGKRPPDAGFSYLPIIPVFAPGFFGIAKLADVFFAPWGSVTIFWFHVALAVIFAVVIPCGVYRIRSAKRLSA